MNHDFNESTKKYQFVNGNDIKPPTSVIGASVVL